MKNYTLQRFVKLSLYFLLMYGTLTAAWYGVSGRFGENAGTAINELLLNSILFSLMFTLALLTWYRRTERRIPLKAISQRELDLKLESIGYERVPSQGGKAVQVYKPRPPKAPALAGKIFLQKSANFYHIQGPKKKVESLEVRK